MAKASSVFLPQRMSALMLSEAVLSAACYSGALLFEGKRTGDLQTFESAASVLLVVASVLFGCYLTGLYRVLVWRSRVSLFLHVCSVFGIALLVQGVLGYLDLKEALPRQAMLIGSLLNFGAMVLWRLMYSTLMGKVFAAAPTVLLGDDDVICEIAWKINERPELGMAVIGFLSDRFPEGTPLAGGRVVGSIAQLPAVIKRLSPKRLIVATHDAQIRLPLPELMEAKRNGISVQDAATAYEKVCGRVCSRTFLPSQIIFSNDLSSKPGILALQSIYTNLVALVGFVLSIPFLILLSLAIRLTSRGPAWIPEAFAGFQGIPFTAYRLRCETWGEVKTSTLVGRLIRFLRLEHLPRALNLVRGEMALVGPEPERVEFAEFLASSIPFYRERYIVKPGLTGWNQIHSTRKEPVDCLRAIECDLYYTKHISLPLDAYILLHTVRTMLPFQDR